MSDADRPLSSAAAEATADKSAAATSAAALAPAVAASALPRPKARTAPRHGIPIILTADRTLFAGYRILFEGMVSASQTSRTPSFVMKTLLAPAARRDGVRAFQAPLGLRRVESALARAGFQQADVAIVDPASLKRAIGPDTRIIGISSGDPLGLGMNSTTMSAILGGEIYTSCWFRRLAESIHRLRRAAPEAKVVLGGAGAWQLAGNLRAQEKLGIDHVISGYCEGNVADLFDRILNGEELPAALSGERVSTAEAIPPILGPTLMGGVEISRGCGLGCAFCTLARQPMEHLPMDAILADAQTNLAAGVTDLMLVTEDVFRYGAQGTRAQPAALIELIARLRSLPATRLIQTDHANVGSAAQFSDEELAAVRRGIVGSGRHDFVWLNLGVETASGPLLAANGGRAKMAGVEPEAWDEFCEHQVRRLVRLGYFPLISILFGLPGETPDDVERTFRWVQRLSGERLAVFPLFNAPLAAGASPFGLKEMSPAHWRLFRACYDLNFRWVPRLFWDNQSAAGVPLWRRGALQALGRAQTLAWKCLFAARSGRIRS
jgi:radical SAM superfamily enzyme YgiQ (UPF0313 family)